VCVLGKKEKMVGKLKPALIVCLAIMLTVVMSMPLTAAASSKVVKVKVTRTKGSVEQMVVKGLTRSNKVVWKYTSKKYAATELLRTKCIVRGTRVYIFDSTTLRILSKASGKRLYTTKHLTMASHAVGFDKHSNIYVTGYYDTVLYKVSPKGKLLWKTNYDKTGKYWAYKIKATTSRVTVICGANDKYPGESGPYKVVFSASKGAIL
jgi:hypothetical protein